jgi:hypothetical protein
LLGDTGERRYENEEQYHYGESLGPHIKKSPCHLP